MERTDESSVIVTEHGATAKKIYSFPSFIDAQFWTWQIIEFCRRNGLHLIIDKTRRGGFLILWLLIVLMKLTYLSIKLLFMLQLIINI